MTDRTNLSGVTVGLTAHHFDPTGEEGWHEHTWRITGFWPSEPFIDMRKARERLAYAISELPVVKGRLPADMWSAEAIGRALIWGKYADGRAQPARGRRYLGMVCIRVARDEGFEAWVWA